VAPAHALDQTENPRGLWRGYREIDDVTFRDWWSGRKDLLPGSQRSFFIHVPISLVGKKAKWFYTGSKARSERARHCLDGGKLADLMLEDKGS